MSSVWTRNFYDRECVADAVVGSLVYKHPLRKQHALFWAHELWVSEEVDLLLRCLTKAFLMFPPFQGGMELWKGLSAEESSVLAFLGVLLAQAPLVLQKTSEKPACADLKKTVQKAELRNQTTRLFLLLDGLSVKEISEFLSPAVLKGVDADLLKVWRQTGKGLAWILGVPEQPRQIPIRCEWPTRRIGTLAARTFRTPKRRHSLNPSPFGVFAGCAVWQRILKEAGLDFAASEKAGDLVFETVAAEEAFYRQYFPDDIPDEWSQVEKEKGHLLSEMRE
jgi:hypothetical protein